MEIKINREVRNYHETIFFGLSARQFFCSVTAIGIAVGAYFLFINALGKEITSWLCIAFASPFAVAGFFSYNSMPFEKFICSVIKTKFLFGKRRLYISENLYEQILKSDKKTSKRRTKHNEDI